HTRSLRDWSSDVCSSDLETLPGPSEPDNRPARMPVPTQGGNVEGLTGGQTSNSQPDSTFPADDIDAFWQDYLHSYIAHVSLSDRSEERRVGKECIAQRWG